MGFKTMSKSFKHSFIHDKNDQDLKNNYNFNERRSSLIEINTDNIYQEQFQYTTTTHDIIPNINPTPSLSTPSYHQSYNPIDPVERIQFLREMENAREELAEFRRNMSGLVKQMDGMTTDLNESTDRVSEIEQDLTATEEVNVNLQVLLEKAVRTQKESDIFATQAIRNMYSDLASVVYENSQLQGRLAFIESQQKEQKGNVHDIIKRMYEYTEMLEQAQGTIHMLQEPRLVKIPSTSTSRRTSISEEDDVDDEDISVPVIKPQQGLKMLLNNESGSQLGLSSIAPRKL